MRPLNLLLAVSLSVFSFCPSLNAQDSQDFLKQHAQSLIEKILPTLVLINCELSTERSIPQGCSQHDMMWAWYQPKQNQSFLDWILGKSQSPLKTAQAGYGFFISSDGYIVTSYLTVKDAKKITITFFNQLKTEQVKVIGYDAKSNLALLKIEGENLPYLNLEECSVKLGEWVVGIGNTTAGQLLPRIGAIASYPLLNSRIVTYETVIQSDLEKIEIAGDPLLNLEGKVIGVNIISDFVELTIPSPIVKEILQDLKAMPGH